MCLAIPVRVTKLLDGDRALVSAGGILREIDTALVDNLQVGDYVILHVGYALSKLDETEAAKTLEAMAAISASGEVSHEIH
jgi:hydrogenase expression/formation protein HypC